MIREACMKKIKAVHTARQEVNLIPSSRGAGLLLSIEIMTPIIITTQIPQIPVIPIDNLGWK